MERSVESIVEEIQLNPDRTLEIFRNTPLKNNKIIRQVVMKNIRPSWAHSINSLFPEPTVEETRELFNKCSPQSVVFLFKACFYRLDPNIRHTALTKVTARNVLLLWNLMCIFTFDEVVYTYKKAPSPLIVLAMSRLYDDEGVQDVLLENTTNSTDLIKLYCSISEPTLAHSVRLIKKSSNPLIVFNLCVHRHSPTLRRAFIDRVLKLTNFQVQKIAFSIIPNKTINDVHQFLNGGCTFAFWSSEFTKDTRTREIFLKLQNRTLGVLSLAEFSDPTSEDIAVVENLPR